MRNSSLFIILQKMRKPFLVIIVTYTISIIGFLFIGGKDSSGNYYQMTLFDAFYFVSYTATTIGFGEIPYAFTYPQRIWVTISTFLTVLGWFYSIGTLVSLLQDKLFLQELERARFLKQIKNLNEKFIIILGYNQITRKIIIKAIEQGIRAVVIEKDSLKIEKLVLENFTPTVPVLFSESFTVRVLESAGLKKRNCKAIVSLFDDDAINLKITLIAKTLNKSVKVAVKSTTINQTENLRDLDAQIIVNPFSIISSEIKMALTAPNLFKLEKWLYKIDNLNANLPTFPKGLYVICGYGRMGAKIFEKLDKNNVEVKFIEINKERNKQLSKDEKNYVIFGDADDRELLEDIGIKNAVVIIAATNDDTTNLSILATARKLNPDIITMARENDLADDFLFRSAKVNHIFTPSKILVNKITNALMNPLCDEFLKLIIKENNEWATKLVIRLIKEIDENPLIMAIEINLENTPEIYKHLSEKNILNVKILSTSLHNNSQSNNIVPLLLQRENDIMLLPSWETEIKIDDNIVFSKDVDIEPNKRGVAIVFQNYALLPHLNVASNITFGSNASKEELKEILEKTKLKGHENKYPHELSGGQQQRVALARAVINKPKILLLDEPLSNIDTELRNILRLELKEMIKEFNITALFITHDKEDAFFLSDRIAIMHGGDILQVGTCKELYNNPEDLYCANFLGKISQISENEYIRPENIKICSNGKIEAIIKDIIFYGSFYEVTVVVNHKDLLVYSADDSLKIG